ncbi:MAG: hypothetical protein U1E67_12035 [Hyphomicrobiales bacterium]
MLAFILTLSAARAEDAKSENWESLWWLDRTARLLRDGDGLGPDDDVAALQKLSEEEVARQFMADPRFGDAMLDFNMYFLGFKIDSVKIDGTYVDNAFDFPNAVSAAKAMMSGGDYLTLFDLQGPFFMAPLSMEDPEEDPEPEDKGLSPPQMRAKAIAEVRAAFETLIANGKKKAKSDPRGVCKELNELLSRAEDFTDRFYRSFNDPEIFALSRGRVLLDPLESLSAIADSECSDDSEPPIDTMRIEAALDRAYTQFKRAMKEVESFEPSRYQPQSLADFRPFDLKTFPYTKTWIAFGYEQGIALANSSTNYNRKRAAYVLNRYLCDDLTPVGVEDPKEHASGAHGSDTSCYACHYKLDPMAGFFRNYGALFSDAAQLPDIIFDDLANADRKKYASFWRAPKGSERNWNIGYIRSPRWTDRNDYGENVGDLSHIIRNAPEAKRCLMKRLVDYMVGDDQTVDGAYLDELTRKFTAEARVNSSSAMKNAMIRVLKSNAYRERNRDPQKCYDHAEGTQSGDRPPCRVAYILQKNCTQCHDSAYSGDGNLNLSAWVDAPDGKSKTFPHLDDTFAQVSAKETLAQFVDRISSSDPKKRMPKNKLMASPERQELFLWAQQELNRLNAGGVTP